MLELHDLESRGQQLEAEQKKAVKKLDGVIEMIDILKEIGKNLTDSLNDVSSYGSSDDGSGQVQVN